MSMQSGKRRSMALVSPDVDLQCAKFPQKLQTVTGEGFKSLYASFLFRRSRFQKITLKLTNQNWNFSYTMKHFNHHHRFSKRFMSGKSVQNVKLTKHPAKQLSNLAAKIENV